MATDYDSPRKTDEDINEDSLQELQARRVDKGTSTIDVDPDEVAEGMELPGADLSGEELAVRVLPRQADEFTCSRCFLVHHRSQLAEQRKGQLVCKECAACARCGPFLECLARPQPRHVMRPRVHPGAHRPLRPGLPGIDFRLALAWDERSRNAGR